jgi:hypothetical protein
MSVTSVIRKQNFTMDGAEDEFTFTFRALVSAPEDIKCQTTIGTTITDLIYNTQFTVAVNADGTGGVVTLVSPATIGAGTLTVYRDTTNKQLSDYDDYNQFPADTLETDLDKRTLVSQEHSEEVDRAVKFPLNSSASGELPEPTGHAGELIVVNATEDGLDYTAGTAGPTGPTGPAGGITGGTLTGIVNLGEGSSATPIGWELDATLSADGTYSGLTEDGTSGETVVFGDLCTLHTDGKWYKGDANTAAASSGDCRRKLGVCVKAATGTAGTSKMILWGKVRADSKFDTFPVGTAIYCSETAGSVTATQGTTTDVVIRIVGFANTADSIHFQPSPDYITHT